MMWWCRLNWLMVLFGCFAALESFGEDDIDFRVVVDAERLETSWKQRTDFGGVLKGEKVVQGCHMPHAFRYVQDDFLSEREIQVLVEMMDRGMAMRPKTGGPTILDINSGYLRDGDGLINIYEGDDRVIFTKEEYDIYRDIFSRINDKIKEVNGLSTLYFTAPTFVARIIGEPAWQPKTMHDEYWHPHVDKENTFHYDYSGLVYLKTHGVDFDGGEYVFLDEGDYKAVLPRAGRFISFASGRENPHRFLKVRSGTRLTLSMWFTCDESKQFKTFLNGKAHKMYLSDSPEDIEEKVEL